MSHEPYTPMNFAREMQDAHDGGAHDGHPDSACRDCYDRFQTNRIRSLEAERDALKARVAELEAAGRVAREAFTAYEMASDSVGAGSGPEIERVQMAYQAEWEQKLRSALAALEKSGLKRRIER